jgi:hypothetical protein
MFNIQFEITNVPVTFTDRSTIRIVDTSTNITLTIAVLKTNQNDGHGVKPTKNHIFSRLKQNGIYFTDISQVGIFLCL